MLFCSIYLLHLKDRSPKLLCNIEPVRGAKKVGDGCTNAQTKLVWFVQGRSQPWTRFQVSLIRGEYQDYESGRVEHSGGLVASTFSVASLPSASSYCCCTSRNSCEASASWNPCQITWSSPHTDTLPLAVHSVNRHDLCHLSLRLVRHAHAHTHRNM